jgi:hypothetical protein
MAKLDDWQQMAGKLQEMLDHYEITRVISTYCHACDRLDQVQTANVYWEDSWDDHGFIKAPGPEFAELATKSLAEISEMCSHQLGQSLVNVRGDEAGAETYFQAVTVSRTEDGSEVLNLLGGRFVDTLVRRGGEWKFKTRLVVRDWSMSQPITRDWLQGMGHVPGRRSNDDPSCAVLAMPHSGIPAET